ncbi:hypothetical protein SNE40_017665 [Patella caerulea]|uniref:Small integral membrane protein 8 n=1 Tax=Patella caerulea TaxID=87958 RepID=A0AAN8PQA1_PATCE
MSDKTSKDEAKPRKLGLFEIRDSGFGKAKSTSVFRAVNFELYAKPNKFVMTVGLTAFLGCVGYMIYMNVTDDKKSNHYNTINLDGSITARAKTSRWD